MEERQAKAEREDSERYDTMAQYSHPELTGCRKKLIEDCGRA